MTVSFSIKSILAVSLMLITSLMSSTASALFSKSGSGGFSLTQDPCVGCSVRASDLLVGLSQKDVSAGTTFNVTLLIKDGFLFHCNPGENCGGLGTPFLGTNAESGGTHQVTSEEVSKNGKSLANVVIHDSDMFEAIKSQLATKCSETGDCDAINYITYEELQHPNWEWAVIPTSVQALGKEYTNGELQDAEGAICTAPGEVVDNIADYVGVYFQYSCSEVCQNSGNSLPDCPANLPLD